jgi:adenylyltransferase/sulfurtransferase
VKPIAELRVLVVGAGGLGSPALFALAQSGVGTLGVCDDDVVDLSNLARQLLHTTADLGRRKVDSAARALSEVAPSVRVLPYPERLSVSLAEALVPQFDIIVDGSDNFATKFLVSDACVLYGKPFVIGAAVRWGGQVLPWAPGKGAGCYRCLFEELPPQDAAQSCQEAGIVGAVCGVVGGLEAAAVLALAGHSTPDLPIGAGHIYLYDALAAKLRAVPLRSNPECRSCGAGASIRGLSPQNYLEQAPPEMTTR